MKITKKQLRKIIKEYADYGGNLTINDVRKVFPKRSSGEQIDIHDEFGESTNNAGELKAAYIKKYGSLDENLIREAWADKGVDLVQFIIDNIQAESNPTGAVDWDTDELYEFLEKEGWTEGEIDFAVEDPRVGKYFDKLEGLYSAEQGTLEDYKQHPEWFN